MRMAAKIDCDRLLAEKQKRRMFRCFCFQKSFQIRDRKKVRNHAAKQKDFP